jgi:hypothetical protein
MAPGLTESGNTMRSKSREPVAAQNGAFEVLDLDLCPEPVQVMPPAGLPQDPPPHHPMRALPLALSVMGNLLVGAALLGGLLLMPLMIARLTTGF